jgi:death-on-curing family protein
MTDSFKCENGNIVFTLKKDCIIDLHDLLSNSTHLIDKMDAVEPQGVKNIGMLESAIGRQLVGSGVYYKYPDFNSNCATLIFGIIKNHCFHNGNKRAGLLSLIKHLYVNGYVLSPKLNSNEIYEFLIAIANSKIPEFSNKYRKKYSFIRTKEEKLNGTNWHIDTIIRYIGFWIKRNSSPKQKTLKGELKMSDLKKILQNKNIVIDQIGGRLEVYIEKESKFLGIKLPTSKKTNKRKYNLGGNLTTIEKSTLNTLRKDFNLTKADGVDNTFFYHENSFLDYEIKTYKELIYRLSKN